MSVEISDSKKHYSGSHKIKKNILAVRLINY